jgi:hypothetical protein
MLVAVAEKWKSCLQYDVEFAGRVGGLGPRALVQRDAPKNCATKLYCRLSSVYSRISKSIILSSRQDISMRRKFLISELETDNLIKSILAPMASYLVNHHESGRALVIRENMPFGDHQYNCRWIPTYYSVSLERHGSLM